MRISPKFTETIPMFFRTGDTYVDGRPVAGTETQVDIVASVQRLTMRDRQLLPEGFRASESYKLYTETDVVQLILNGPTFQASNLAYTGQFDFFTAIEISIDGVAMAGSPVPFNTSHQQTLDDLNAVILADPKISACTNTFPPTNLVMDGAVIGDYTIETQSTGATVRAIQFDFDIPMVAGQTFEYTVSTPKAVPFNTDWETTLADIGTVVADDIGNFPGISTPDVANNSVLVQDTSVSFNGNFAVDPFVSGSGTLPVVSSTYFNNNFRPIGTFTVLPPDPGQITLVDAAEFEYRGKRFSMLASEEWDYLVPHWKITMVAKSG